MKILLRPLLFCVLLLPLAAQAQWRWQEGKDYALISPAVSSGMAPAGKIEVTEVFSYGCPYCYQGLTAMSQLQKSLPPDVAFTLVHASFVPSEGWPMFQRAWLTARKLGIAEPNHEAFFDAIWKTGEFPLVDPTSGRLRQPLPTIEDAAAFYAKHSKVSAADFLATARSAEIDAQVKAQDDYVKNARVPGTPSLVVNGRYLVNSAAVGSWEGIQQLIAFLIAQERTRLAK
ncbi:MAG: thiol:disulfide interchange protein DsbA/DsbL [Nevskiaceae bacterium]|jgi:thiol:disulfide interchange protein DsbA|nr:thiol:disulfide interchange protein DsbA/DsbL [Nevskiaceae bacterium]